MLDVTPILKLYAWRRSRQLARLDPVAAQERELLQLIAAARDTRFGKDHDFRAIGSAREFQARVPLRNYEAFWQDYWQPSFPRLVDCTWPGTIPFFALTSGTTSAVTKSIPCSHQMNKANERAALDLLVHHLTNRPRSRLLGGRNFMLGGSTALTELAPGIYSGDLSSIAAKVIPWWARLRYLQPRELETSADWETKIGKLAAASLAADIRSISGTPSWLLVFFDKLMQLSGAAERRLANFYPNLELLVHGAVNFAPYRKTFEALLEGSHAETREVYAASEGFVAIADRGDGEGMRLVADNGLFFEFVPLEELDAPRPTRHWLKDAQPGVNYALVVSSCAGLWAYVLGDTVRFVDLAPPRILITGRTSYMLSAFGEHLIAEEIEQSVAGAAEAIGANVVDYSVGALIPERSGDLGQHLYIIEFAGAVPAVAQIQEFVRALDERLAATNQDYGTYRAGGHRLNAPRVHAVPPGTFAAWMKQRGQLGGQHKVPRIINDPALFEALRRFAGCP